MGNNPNFHDILDGSYGVEVVLEREEFGYEYYSKVTNLPMSADPMEPHSHDVLMGRGGKNNQWCGNEKLRTMARTQSENYRMSSKKGKSYISRELVRRVRELNPPGRFLKKDEGGGWEDVGDEVAREKASQVLRDAVAVGMNSSEDASDGELEKGMETLSTKHQRSVSAPPVMATSRRRRPRDWEGQSANTIDSISLVPSYQHQPYTPPRSMSSIPKYPQPLYHSSPKRRRYCDNRWVAYDQQENHPPYHPGMYGGYARHSGYPTQHVVYRPVTQTSSQQIESAEAVDDFDLFNGELLRSDTESPDIETSGSF